MIEKMTVARLGEPKTINYTNKKTGKPDSFNKVGLLTKEHGEKWYDFTFRGNHGLEVGKQYEFELSSREYNGKTYWDAKFVKPADKVDVKLEQILNKLVGINIDIQILKEHIVPAKEGHKGVKYPTAESEGIDPEKAFPNDEDELNNFLNSQED